jgi:hypothetical protein
MVIMDAAAGLKALDDLVLDTGSGAEALRIDSNFDRPSIREECSVLGWQCVGTQAPIRIARRLLTASSTANRSLAVAVTVGAAPTRSDRPIPCLSNRTRRPICESFVSTLRDGENA